MSSTDCIIVYCNCPTQTAAEDLAREIIELNHAACVNIITDISSVYKWEGELKFEKEQMLVIKTTASKYGALETYIQQNHPYECPEIVSIDIDKGSDQYLSWLKSAIYS